MSFGVGVEAVESDFFSQNERATGSRLEDLHVSVVFDRCDGVERGWPFARVGSISEVDDVKLEIRCQIHALRLSRVQIRDAVVDDMQLEDGG